MNSYEYEMSIVLRKTTDEGTKTEIVSIDTVKADDMAKCLMQFNLTLMIVMRKVHDMEMEKLRALGFDDDIPF